MQAQARVRSKGDMAQPEQRRVGLQVELEGVGPKELGAVDAEDVAVLPGAAEFDAVESGGVVVEQCLILDGGGDD